MAIGRAAALSTLLIFAAVLSTEGCGVAVNKNQEASSREIHRVRREAPETIVDDVKAVNEDLPHEARKLLWHSEDINDRDGNKKSRTKRDLSWPSSSLGTWSDLLSGLTAEAEAEPTAGDVMSQVQAEAEPSLDDLLSQAQAQVQAEPSIDEFLEQSQSQSQGQSQSEFQGISQDIQIVNGTIVYCQQDCENGGVCTGLNVCRCAPGWTGTYCTDHMCTQTCVHGSCSGPNTCLCDEGYQGETCEQAICNPVCANGGVCTAPNECQCEEGYEGDQCQTAICHSTCENGGYCSRPDFCTCQIGYAGQQCETPVCDPSCLHGGACSAPDTCTCQAGWEGPICQTPICTLECQNGGVCTEPGRCSCPSSFGGPQCQYDLYQDDGITQVQTTPAPDHSGRFCGAFGHQHYFTFDGHFYTFPGTCQYLLSGDCLQATFQVFVRNDPNCTTSSLLCHREVRVHMMGLSHDLILHQGHNYEVTKGDVTLSLPNSEEGVKVEKVGDYVRVILMPEFDGKLVRVAVYWDGVTSVYVEVDEDFAGNLCGLCGNFNGNSSDEYRLRDGTASISRITFANSWKMTDAEEHCPNVHVNTPNSCSSATQQQLQEIWGICNVLIGNAAFAPCHAVVDPNPYIDACVTDLCNCDYAVRGDCQCEALTQYSRACAHRRIVLDWRQPELCYRGCPATMVYTECASSCPRTCRNPTGDHDCDDHCVDGCSCPEGSLWDEGSLQCVVEQECPCTHLGMEYAPGSNYLDDCNKYYCLAGRWIGTNLECNATCSIHGDPHITTFDKRYYQFAGVCQYIVAKDFVNQQFTLLADQQPCGDDDSSSCIRSVTLIVGGNTAGKIKLHQHGVLSVGHSDVHIQLPYHNDDVSVRRLSSVFVEVTTNFGLTLQWDGRGRLYTTVTPALKGHTKGLCGTFNDKQNDDFTTRSGVIVANVAEFGNSWKVSADCEDQPVVTSDLQLGPCAINTQRAEYARQHCGLMSGGSFEACNRLLEPATYITACEYDVCQCQDGDECLCSAIAHYARECAKLGAVVNWRTEGTCVEECPQVGQVWQECSSACRSSCRYLSEPDSGCTEDCVAGCNCPPGLYQSESGACVPQEECQCFYQGEVYQTQTSTVLGNLICFCEDGIMNCQERVIMSSEYNCTSGMEYFDCEGAAAGQMGKACEETCGNIGMECLAEQCVSGCQCPHGLVRDGSECVLPEECRCEHNGQMYDPGQTISVDCNSCTCSQGVWSCTTKECAAQCSMFGNSHYTTFDGHSYEFEGTCKYIIAQDYCYNQTGSFRIHAEKTACNGLSGNVCARTVTVTLQQLQIHLEHGKDVHVGPIPGSEVAYTSYKFNIYRSGFFTIIKVENGIDLYWDNATRLYIKVWPNHRGRVCGMCGNFDGNQINDFNTPELDRATTVQDFANSWKVSSSCPDVEAPLSDYCALHPHREAWARRQCNIILSDTFSPCHYKVDPEPYYQACVQDSCSCDSGGDCECFCTAVAAYGDMCNTQDVHIRWRTHELCPTQCEDYNWDPEKCEWHYDPCGTSCPATCEDPHPSSCDLQCMEGCHPKCPNGTVLYNGKCIPPMDCPVTTTTPLPTTTAFIPTTVSTTLLPTTTESIATTTLEVTTASETTPIPTTTRGGEGGGKTTTAAPTTEVTPTGSPSPPIQTTTEATTTQSTTTFSTTTPEVTTPCEHAEVCYWTSWINSDLPRAQRTADNETLAHLLQAGSNICMHPSMIECRTSSHNPNNMRLIPTEQVDQEVTCDVDQGFLCLAELQENPFCLDYEVRLYCCSCGGTVPPTSTLSTTTISTTTQSTTTESTTSTVPTTTQFYHETTTTIVSTTPCEHVQEMCEWKEWMNKEYPNPNSPSQNETYANLRDTYDFCDTPMDIQCSISGMPMNTPFESMAQEGVICDINTGLYCDASQIPGFFAVCYDYEIRVKCCWEECVTPTSTAYQPTTTESTTISTTAEPTTTESTTSTVSTTTQPTTTESIVTTTPCEHVEEMCEWSDWMNKDEPSGGNPNQNETYDNLRDIYEFCEEPMDIECSVAGMEGTQMSLPEGVSCDQATGLVCYASQLPGKGQVCEDYQIRVKCCSEKCVTPVPTTTRPATTPTATVSTTTLPTTTETTTVSTTTQPTTTETTTVSTTTQPTTTETTSSTTVMTPTGSPSPTQPPTTESTTVSTTTQPTTTESTTVSTTTQPTTTESTSTVSTTSQPTTTESTTVSTEYEPTTTESTTVSTTSQPTTTESTTVSTTQPTTTESTTSTVSTTTQSTTTESTTVSTTQPTSTESTTTIVSTTPCEHVQEMCEWSDWMNKEYPNPNSPSQNETYANLRDTYDFCDTPMEIQCGISGIPMNTPFESLAQEGVMCDINTGLYCDASQISGFLQVCYDYEIRVKCCWEECVTPTPTRPTTTESTTVSTTTKPTTTESTTVSTEYQPTTTESTTVSTTTKPTTTESTTVSTEYQPTTTESTTVSTEYQPTTTESTTVSTAYQPTITESTTVATTTKPTTTESTTVSTEYQPTTTESTTVSTEYEPTITESTTVSTTTKPTTTESTTVSTTIITTTPCEHVEEMCEWSDWMNKDEPSGGNPNQNETYDNLRDTYEFCEEPMDIECSVAGMEGTQMSLPEGVSCDQATGLVCYASQLPGKGQVCEDYQIRVKCCSEKCVTPVPTTTRPATTTTATVSTTTQPTTTETSTVSTTAQPTTTETTSSTTVMTPTGSPSPTQPPTTESTTVSTTSQPTTTESTTVSTEYEPTTTESTTVSTTSQPTTTESTTVSTTIITTTPCEHVEEMCEWSDWMNKDEPSGNNPNQNETYDNLRDTYEFCEEPMDIECSVAGMEGTQMSLPEGVSCDQATGLVCYASQLPGKGQVCEDYQIRVKCCSEKCVTPVPTTTRPATTPTTTVSTTTQPTTTESTSTVSTAYQPTTTESTTVSTTTQPTTTESTTVSTTTQPTTTESTTVSTTTQPTTTESTTVSTTTQPTTTESTTVTTAYQPTTTESTTVSTTTKPTTIESTTVSTAIITTTPCEHVEEMCEWSDWMNKDEPSGGNPNQNETYDNLRDTYEFCEEPMDIECSVAGMEGTQMSLPEGVSCDQATGLVCYASQLPGKGQVCEDYQIRVKCCSEKCVTPVPTTRPATTPTATVSTTTQPTTTETTTVSTTTQPTTTETTSSTTVMTPTGSPSPTQPPTTESTTVSTTTEPTTTESTTSTVSTTTQPTTTESTTVSTTVQSTTPTSCGYVCNWTDWMNSYNPSTDMQLNDVETLENLHSRFSFCETPMGIECRYVENPDLDFIGHHQPGVTCEVDSGLYCDASLTNVGACMDYEVRFQCCHVPDSCKTTTTVTTEVPPTTTTVTTEVPPTTTTVTTEVPPPTTTVTTEVPPTTTTVTTEVPPPTTTVTTEVPPPTTTVTTEVPTTTTTVTTERPLTTITTESTTVSTTTQPTTTESTTVSTTTQPTTTESTTVSTTTKPTTTESTTVSTTIITTTPCEHVEEMCEWSDWMNKDEPSGGNPNQNETYDNLRDTYEFCEEPMDIECSVAGMEGTQMSLPEGVSCDQATGLVCYASQLPGKGQVCEDYQIRVKCCSEKCVTPVPTTTRPATTPTATVSTTTLPTTTETTTVSTTTQPTTTETTTVSTTTQPTTTEETTSITTEGTTSIATPTGSPSPYQTTTISTTPITTSTHSTTQPPTTTAIRPTTTKMMTTQPTTTRTETTHPTTTPPVPTTTEMQTTKLETTPTSCGYVCNWTDWMNSYNPSTDMQLNDVETLENLHSRFSFCETPMGIECRYVENPDLDFIGHHQPGVTCEVDSGLYCNASLTNVGACMDYEVRFQCCHVPDSCKTTTTVTTEVPPTTTTVTTEVPPTTTTVTTEVPPTTATVTTEVPSTTTLTTTVTTEGTTTVETTTEYCQETCVWSEWMNSDYPGVGVPNDNETFAHLRESSLEFCEEPDDIECRLDMAPNIDFNVAKQSGVECNVSSGLMCLSKLQPSETPFCYDYSVRVKCCSLPAYCTTTQTTTTPSTTVSTTTQPTTTETTTVSTTTQPTTTESTTVSTTTQPTTTETSSSTTVMTPTGSPSPTQPPTTESTTVSTTSQPTTTESTTVSTTTQPTTTESTTVSTTVQSTTPTSCGYVCNWTDWMNSYNPSTDMQLNDVETLENLHSRFSFCETPMGIECRYVENPDLDFIGHHQPGVTCEVDSGLYCNASLTNVGACMDYEVRFQCCHVPDSCKTTTTVTTEVPTTTTVTTERPLTTITTESTTVSTTTQPTTTESTTVSTTALPTTTAFLPPSTTECPDVCIDGSGGMRQVGDTWFEAGDQCQRALYSCRPCGEVSINRRVCDVVEPPSCANGLQPIDVGVCCPEYHCPCECKGYGDPHYFSFDGEYFYFQGEGEFILARDTHVPHDFEVRGFNVQCTVAPITTCTKEIKVIYNGHTIELKTGHQVLVNGTSWTVPFKLDGCKVTTMGFPLKLEIQSLDVTVVYDFLSSGFYISVPPTMYAGKTEGLCGPCNNNKTDDCQDREGTIMNDYNNCSCDWKVDNPDSPSNSCIPEPKPTSTPSTPCDQSPCGVISDPEGPFGACHDVVDYEFFLQSCQYDRGACYSECQALGAYAYVCQRMGVCVDWRGKGNNCSFECEAGLVYKACSCVKTCENMDVFNASQCALAYMETEGCFCPDDMVLHVTSEQCIEGDTCNGCEDANGMPHAIGDTWIPYNDSCQECTCTGHKKIECYPRACPTYQPPKCGVCESQRVVEGSDSCCPEYECVCDLNRADCPEVVIPQCEYHYQYVHHTNPGECVPEYECRCNSSKCPAAPQCEPPKVLDMLEGECCLEYECVCDACPTAPTPYCPPGEGYVLVSSEDICGCVTHSCECRNDTCAQQPECDDNKDLVTTETGCCPHYNCTCNTCPTHGPVINCKYAEGYVLVSSQDDCGCVTESCECREDSCSSEPECPDNKHVVTVETGCCPRYNCSCNSCPPSPTPGSDCPYGEMPGYVIHETVDDCGCVNSSCTCDRSRCPAPPTCDDNKNLVALYTPCCQNYTCECKECPVDDTSCGIGETQTTIIDDCCSHTNCTPEPVCVYQNTTHQPGTSWTDANDNCIQCQCLEEIDPATGFHRVSCSDESSQCEVNCPACHTYQERSGECCGECVKTSCCVMDDDETLVEYPAGSNWTSPGDSCSRCYCLEAGEHGQVVESCSTLLCPEPPTCSSDEVMKNTTSADGCCTIYECVPPGQASCSLFTKQDYLRVDDCVSLQPVNVTWCEGRCGSSSMYEGVDLKHTCECCHEVSMSEVSVPMECEGTTTSSMSYAYRQITACDCDTTECEVPTAQP